MTKYQVLKTLRSNEDAAVYLWRGETNLDEGESARMISPSIFCKLFRDGRGRRRQTRCGSRPGRWPRTSSTPGPAPGSARCFAMRRRVVCCHLI
jgi:hypothetical protein